MYIETIAKIGTHYELCQGKDILKPPDKIEYLKISRDSNRRL